MRYEPTIPLVTSKLDAMDIDVLREYHTTHRVAVVKRLKEFEALRGAPGRRLFGELCYCILTPQSNALSADKAVLELDKKRLLSDPISNNDAVGSTIRGVRFWKSKTKYITNAWIRFASADSEGLKKELLAMRKKLGGNRELRNWLRLEMRGMGIGMKEASHFLRNIGYGKDLAIIDRHIMKCLNDLDVICDITHLRSNAHYLELEERVADFSMEIGLPMEELDILFWSAKTGFIFK